MNLDHKYEIGTKFTISADTGYGPVSREVEITGQLLNSAVVLYLVRIGGNEVMMTEIQVRGFIDG